VSHTSTAARLEAGWLLQFKRAQAHYWHALEHQQLMIAELDQALMEDVGSSFAVALSKRAEKLALDDVVRCQKILVDLVLRKNMPPQDTLNTEAMRGQPLLTPEGKHPIHTRI
jgi:hypothetical protein